jgi:hypothetical protein
MKRLLSDYKPQVRFDTLYSLIEKLPGRPKIFSLIKPAQKYRAKRSVAKLLRT